MLALESTAISTIVFFPYGFENKANFDFDVWLDGWRE